MKLVGLHCKLILGIRTFEGLKVEKRGCGTASGEDYSDN